MLFHIFKVRTPWTLGIFVFTLLWQAGSAAAEIHYPTNEKEYVKNMETCTDTQLGVTFRCAADWDIHNVEDAVIIVISSENPVITLTISRFDSKIRYLEQVTSRMLRERHLYEDGFKMEHVTFAGMPALKVKAFAKGIPNRRMVDYFFLRKGELYGVLFTVQPRSTWEKEQYLLKAVIDSFRFF